MKSLFLAAILAFAPVLTAAAQSAPIRVFIDIPRAMDEAGLSQMTDEETRSMAALSSQVKAAEAEGMTLQRDYNQIEATLNENSRAEWQDKIRSAQRDHEDALRAFDRTMSRLQNAKLQNANKMLANHMTVFQEGSRIGVLEMIDSREVPRVIIRNKRYDVTSALAEMARSGPGAEAPPRPQVQARTAYLNFDNLIAIAALDTPAYKAFRDLQVQKTNELDTLATEARDLQRQATSPGLTEEMLRQLSDDYDSKINQLRAAQDSITRDLGEARDITNAKIVTDIAAFAETDPSAAGWDVIRIYSPGTSGGSIQIIDPTLDITDEVATAYKATLQ